MLKWYVINTYAGKENKVAADMRHRIETMEAKNLVKEIIVPVEEVFEGHGSDRKQVSKRTMPGYILVRADLNDKSWDVIRYTPGVTGFVGAGAVPHPLSKIEVDRILGKKVTKPVTAEVVFKIGDLVKILEGPLQGMEGNVGLVDSEDRKAKILVSIFGRETPTELPFESLEHAS